jgi:hypothetical protein
MEVLWEKIKFWKKPKVYKEDVDYRFVNFEGTDVTGIELLLDNFKGVVYHYHSARVKEEGEMARLQFGYTLIYPGTHDLDELNQNENFHVIMGDILTQLLMSKAKEDESFRNNHTKKFDLQ